MAKTFLCVQCDIEFFKPDLLIAHVNKLHANERLKDYECKPCEKIYRSKGHLARHISAIHQNKRNHKCEFY